MIEEADVTFDPRYATASLRYRLPGTRATGGYYRRAFSGQPFSARACTEPLAYEFGGRLNGHQAVHRTSRSHGSPQPTHPAGLE